MYNVITPGPTKVKENVLNARSLVCTNPDLDFEFVENYNLLCKRISKLLNTENETLILGGEGILGLEAACASLTEDGDRVLVIDNGIFGGENPYELPVTGDWYFTGNYPTPGGVRMLNRAFVDYYEKNINK